MRRSKRWVSASNLTIPLTVVVGLSLCSITLAQEKPWMTLNQEAHQLYQQGKHQEGVKVAKEALSVAEKIFGTDSPVAAISLNILAELYRAQGQYALAEPLHKRALAIREKALGSDHPHVAQSLENYAALLRKTNRAAEAAEMESRAKRIRASQ